MRGPSALGSFAASRGQGNQTLTRSRCGERNSGSGVQAIRVAPRRVREIAWTEGPIWDWWQDIMFANDGAKHHRLRGLVNKAFAAHSVVAQVLAILEQGVNVVVPEEGAHPQHGGPSMPAHRVVAGRNLPIAVERLGIEGEGT
ncbi:MAG: hypothetical protein K0Q76_3153 [Panacagrimonas sp.]|nr:hypothetical protein [Panacagrimonas sp.]MCC2658045.1 hypothetical protein [Panacagrimonas sp.]